MWDQVTPTAAGQGEEDGPHGAGPARPVCMLDLWLPGHPCGWSSSQTPPSGVLPGAQGSPRVRGRGVRGGGSVHNSHTHVCTRPHRVGSQQGDSPCSLPGQGAPAGLGVHAAGAVAGSAPVGTARLLLVRVGDPSCG